MNKQFLAILFSFAVFLFLVNYQNKDVVCNDIPQTFPNLELTIPVGMFDTELNGYWLYAPNIKICPDAGVTKSRVKQALAFWENVGYSFGTIIVMENNGLPCESQWGEITFRIPTQQEITAALRNHQLGIAKTHIDRFTQQIMSADIYFQHISASHTQRIVEHELGHALGWKHHDRTSHIMHSSLIRGGQSKIGMERRFYDKRIDEMLIAIEKANND